MRWVWWTMRVGVRARRVGGDASKRVKAVQTLVLPPSPPACDGTASIGLSSCPCIARVEYYSAPASPPRAASGGSLDDPSQSCHVSSR